MQCEDVKLGGGKFHASRGLELSERACGSAAEKKKWVAWKSSGQLKGGGREKRKPRFEDVKEKRKRKKTAESSGGNDHLPEGRVSAFPERPQLRLQEKRKEGPREK